MAHESETPPGKAAFASEEGSGSWELLQVERLLEEPTTEGRPPAVGNAELDAVHRTASDSAVTQMLI